MTSADRFLIALFLTFTPLLCQAQRFAHISSTADETWQKEATAKLASTPASSQPLVVSDQTDAPLFRHWGTCFNELGWDALSLLTPAERDSLLSLLFAPNGELHFTRGRLSVGANDYARSWYSCDETAGDFELRLFNIDRDLTTLIPYIHAAQVFQPDLTCWVSPWSPPSWMKIHGDYPVVSSKYNHLDPSLDYLLYGRQGGIVDEDEMKLTGERNGRFPKQLATTDYMIQDPRYLQAYANYFCRFIDAYKEQGIPIDMVIYQNEAYSYTPYPGCAWTAEGTIRFNRDYLAPTLRAQHPEVSLYLGTFNTNRQDHVERILADSLLCAQVSGLAFQWEGRDILPAIRQQHPQWHYICSESECGWGSFDWKAAEHTFELINHYLANGCDEYIFWNAILTDNGESPWGWKQNALIRVFSDTHTFILTPEYTAVRHYSQFLTPGSQVLASLPGTEGTPLLVCRNPQGQLLVFAANTNDTPADLSLAIGNKYLNLTLPPHSFHTLYEK